MERRQIRLNETISIILSIITLFTVISAGCFWFYKTDGLPIRVDKTEERLDKVEKQLIETSAKTDLIYQGVLEIRNMLMRHIDK